MDKLAIEKNWRNKYNVLVPQADSMGAVAVIRSLGQHGYNVFASSSKSDALGCQSNFIKQAEQCPEYGEQYLVWLRQYLTNNNIHAIIPSEGFYLIIKEHYQEFAHLLPLTSSKEEVYRCLCKVDVFDAFLNSGEAAMTEHISNTQVVSSIADVNWDETATWNYPLFIKGDGFYAHQGDDAKIVKANTLEEAKLSVEEVFEAFHKVIIQDCSQGVKATVNLLFQDGKLLAESMAVATHESPHTGGLTSLRHSWWHQPMYEDAVKRMQLLNWNGPAMVEYKWDNDTQEFDFIELNSRYWAALNLDILAGIHFPCIHLDYFFEGLSADEPIRLTGKINVRNTFPADYGYVLSSLKDNNLSALRKAGVFCEFFVLCFNPFVKADLFYPGDRKLYFINLWEFTKEFANSCLKYLK